MRNWYHDVNISKQAASVKQAANVLSVFVLYRSEKCEQLHRFVNSDSKVYDSFLFIAMTKPQAHCTPPWCLSNSAPKL